MDLAFTFGIVTDGSEAGAARVQRIAESIRGQGMPKYEVIVVGNGGNFGEKVRGVGFDETVKRGWITRKKNLITEMARFEHVVYVHDYLEFLPGWYAGWQHFGTDFSACMNVILNADGTRYRDWSLFYDGASGAGRRYAGMGQFENLLPYSEKSLSRLMYFSGAYFVAKREVMREIPLDERLGWGEGEDVVWSHRFRERHLFSMNAESGVRIFGKKKDVIFSEVGPEKLAKLKEYVAEHEVEAGYGCSDDMQFWRGQGHFGIAKDGPVKATGLATKITMELTTKTPRHQGGVGVLEGEG